MAIGVVNIPLRRRRLTLPRLVAAVGLGLALLLVLGLGALCVGARTISPVSVISVLLGSGGDGTIRTILFDLRLPRVILSIGVGGALASSGVLFQALLRNPLAEPYILGISNGCAVGAILGFLIGAGAVLQPVMAFAGGVVVVIAVIAIGRGTYSARSDSMLLGGVMVGAIGAALIFLLLHFVGPQLRSAMQWMLGDLSSAQASVGYASAWLFAALLGGSFFSGDILNVLALGDEEAASLGVNVTRARTIAYIAGSLVVGAAVSFCGAIGFVGLVVPHILRRIFGVDHRALLPLSVIGGGIFLMLCDTLARSFMPAVDSTASELPVGAVTALVGAPVFIYLLRRGRGR
ncbi:MAG: transport system permease protein [Chlorobi bacterium]|nr:transport system permease protein [Chlorobiota bacterium]